MFSFTLSLVLIPYAIILLLGLFTATVSAYHLVHYGATTRISFMVTFAFFAGTVLILFFTWTALRHVDWKQPISIGAPTTSASALY